MKHTESFQIIIKTLAGFEEILAKEVSATGGEDIQVLHRAVKCTGNNKVLYNINYNCRTALRVLKQIGEFEVRDENDLYYAVKKIRWTDLFTTEQTFAVNAVTSSPIITNSHYAALKAKDAIVDQFRMKYDKRPSIELEGPDLRVHVHITGEKCTLLLDSSGESLHKRGYRRIQGQAPLSEVLAAGMIMLTGWDGNIPLYDPMCGSGTLLTEAAMISRKIPAGYFRSTFGFMNWHDYDSILWKRIKQEADHQISREDIQVFGSDVNQRTLQATIENIRAASMENDIEVKQVAFEDSSPPVKTPGIIITNPPYGERLIKEDLDLFYKTIGNTLKHKYPGWKAWLITSDFPALKSVGLKTSRKIPLYNGPLECKFVRYDLYSGSRKQKWQENKPEN